MAKSMVTIHQRPDCVAGGALMRRSYRQSMLRKSRPLRSSWSFKCNTAWGPWQAC